MGCRSATKKIIRRVMEEVTPAVARFGAAVVKELNTAEDLTNSEKRHTAIVALKARAREEGKILKTSMAGILVDGLHLGVNKLNEKVEEFGADDSAEEALG